MAQELDTALKAVRKGIMIHRRDIVCRAVMWDFIAGAVSAENVLAVLDALSTEEQDYLRTVYNTFPPSLWTGVRPVEQPIRTAIGAWCQIPQNE